MATYVQMTATDFLFWLSYHTYHHKQITCNRPLDAIQLQTESRLILLYCSLSAIMMHYRRFEDSS